MMAEIQDRSYMEEEYLEHISRVMRENESFLREHSRELYGEIAGVMNDAIHQLGVAMQRGAKPQDFVKFSMLYFLNHVLVPVAGAVYVNALTGNLPACIMELRLALESLVKSYVADQKYPDVEFFQDRFHALEKQLQEDGVSISKLMKELDRSLGFKSGSVVLWGKLSEDWVHATGIMDGIVRHLVETSDVPAWGLVIPNSYAEGDLIALDELRKRLSQFRRLLKSVIQEYYGKADFSCA
jgi:hypothetical protein